MFAANRSGPDRRIEDTERAHPATKTKVGEMNTVPARKTFARRLRWVVAAVALVGVGVGSGSAVYLGSGRGLPAIEPLRQQNPMYTSFMRWRSGTSGDPGERENPFGGNPYDIEWLALDSISPTLVCSVVKSEDTTFFEHDGFVWEAMFWAAVRYARGGFGGGSTITQQLAKNLFLGPQVTLRRKFREARITWQIERTLSKRRILEIYLNVVEWGEGVWGVSAASRHYFGKSPAKLDAFEALFLTSLLPGPLEPLTGWNLERFEVSNRKVLDRIYLSGIVSGPEWSETRSRLKLLHTSLGEGRSASAALAPSASALEAPRPPVRYRQDPLPLSAAVAQGCGRERELAEEARRRAVAEG